MHIPSFNKLFDLIQIKRVVIRKVTILSHMVCAL